jgi:hypothetical protein
VRQGASLITGTALGAAVLDGILAGLLLDKVIVHLSARRRSGAVSDAGYARSADLGNGVTLYGALDISASALTIAAFVVAVTRSTNLQMTSSGSEPLCRWCTCCDRTRSANHVPRRPCRER